MPACTALAPEQRDLSPTILEQELDKPEGEGQVEPIDLGATKQELG